LQHHDRVKADGHAVRSHRVVHLDLSLHGLHVNVHALRADCGVGAAGLYGFRIDPAVPEEPGLFDEHDLMTGIRRVDAARGQE